MLLFISSCTIVPNKYYHYEGNKLTSSERVILTSFIDRVEFSNIVNRIEIATKEFTLKSIQNPIISEINSQQYHSVYGTKLPSFNKDFLIEVPSGKTYITIGSMNLRFNAKGGHEYLILALKTSNTVTEIERTSSFIKQKIEWREYFAVYDKTEKKLKIAKRNGDMIDVE
ncbi:MAG: hypothetical protein HRU38_11155 [Saccharospirillaceae bacterium]|nr:hypothetical protein [Saccharospirillaceae bacterium]